MTPRLSICIPSHRPNLLQHAMGSAFGQTVPVQVKVDSTPEWWPEKINDLVRSARSEFVAVLPDDDLLAKTFAADTLAKADEGYDLIFTNYGRLRGDTVYHWPAQPWAFESFCDPTCNPMCGLTWLVRRSVFVERGGFDMSLQFFDWAFLYACFCAGVRAAHVPQPLVVYREHDDQSAIPPADGVAQLRRKYPELSVPSARLPFTHHRLVA